MIMLSISSLVKVLSKAKSIVHIKVPGGLKSFTHKSVVCEVVHNNCSECIPKRCFIIYKTCVDVNNI